MAMGFRLPQRNARLVFSGDYQGAEVVVRLNLPIGTFMEFQDIVADPKSGVAVYEIFAKSGLVSWNLEDEAGAIPATMEGLRRVDPSFATLIIQKWTEAIQNPPVPLVETSANGKSLEGALVETATG